MAAYLLCILLLLALILCARIVTSYLQQIALRIGNIEIPDSKRKGYRSPCRKVHIQFSFRHCGCLAFSNLSSDGVGKEGQPLRHAESFSTALTLREPAWLLAFYTL